jgi:hypothetical protein
MSRALELLIEHYPNFKDIGLLVEDMAAKTVKKASAEFAEYLQAQEFSKHFNEDSGDTRKSIGIFRLKKYKIPTYLIAPGKDIPGHLNYLYGMARGEGVSRSGKKFSYSKKRDFIIEGWKNWGAGSRLDSIFKEAGDNYMKRIEKEITK